MNVDDRLLPITGNEATEARKHPAVNALSIFYKAFNTRDMPLMKQAWLDTDEISMDNPIGGIRRGWPAISLGYDRIFNGTAQVYVEFYDYSIHQTAAMFFATGRERGYFRTDAGQIDLAIRTTRIFEKRDDVWRQIHHHGSIDDPGLLRTYQEAVRRS